MNATEIKPVMSVGRTHAVLSDQGYTYDQIGLSYDQSGITYGGRVLHDIVPLISSAKKEQFIITVQRTTRDIYDQGFTYDQVGHSYDQATVAYGGIYGRDTVPMVVQTFSHPPIIVKVRDIYVQGGTIPSDNSGMLIGILGLTYP